MQANTNAGSNRNFYISYLPDGVYLTVNPPGAGGEKVQTREVYDYLLRKDVKGFSREQVDIAVFTANGMKVRIAEPQEEVKLNASVKITFSPDKLQAFLLIIPPDGGRMLTEDELKSELEKSGVVYGILTELLSSLAKNPVYNQKIVIAEGTKPINGKNSQVEYLFDTNVNSTPKILDDGSVDFRDLQKIQNVIKGQKLCNIIPPEKGIPGKTVTGEEIKPIPGKMLPPPKGKNVEYVESENALIAAIDGQVTYMDGKVNVFSTYEVPADVDNSTGNIKFVGNVVVRGNVLSGFSIEAGGKVEVYGVVEAAYIKAEGDIILKRGIQGMGKGTLISNHDIVSKFIENSNVYAANNIVADAIMHSQVRCSNRLELSGRKGSLVGGNTRVGREIVAKTIGSPMATITEIEVGSDPAQKEKYRELKEELSKAESDMTKARQAINLLRKLESVGKLTIDKKTLLEKSLRTESYLNEKIASLNSEIAVLEESLQNSVFGKVRASSTIYNGVRITIGTNTMVVREELSHCTIYRDGAEIRIGPY